MYEFDSGRSAGRSVLALLTRCLESFFNTFNFRSVRRILRVEYNVELRKSGRKAIALSLVGTSDSHVKVHLNLAESLPGVLINEIRIQQVLLSPLRNSFEAMSGSEGAEFTVTTVQDGLHAVQMMVADTGPRLSAEVAARLILPFTTTKENRMGIGLTICQSTVDSHGGRMCISEDVSSCTTFCIRLPVSNHCEPTT